MTTPQSPALTAEEASIMHDDIENCELELLNVDKQLRTLGELARLASGNEKEYRLYGLEGLALLFENLAAQVGEATAPLHDAIDRLNIASQPPRTKAA